MISPATTEASTASVLTTVASNTASVTTTSNTQITTTSATTTEASGPPQSGEGFLILLLDLDRPFIPQYNNPQSQQYKDLANNVTAECNKGYQIVYPETFLRCSIKGFRPGSVVVETNLIFKNETVVPTASHAVVSLEKAINESKVFLDVIPNTIRTANTTSNSTTATPTTATTTAVDTTTTTTATTIAVDTTASPTTTTAATLTITSRAMASTRPLNVLTLLLIPLAFFVTDRQCLL
ncbi:cell wall protein DAN4-like [Myripristis murdjan]|uniref:cell wall protein DAN4-like n=1 Tax=Myripristis murdjan TaxID=586833 RepID=UPI001175E5F3|nr:cell wall protein DAN4-like [Myripristis murdjan]